MKRRNEVIEETIENVEEVEVVNTDECETEEIAEDTKLQKIGKFAKKHGKKIAAVIGLGAVAVVTYALTKDRNSDDISLIGVNDDFDDVNDHLCDLAGETME